MTKFLHWRMTEKPSHGARLTYRLIRLTDTGDLGTGAVGIVYPGPMEEGY